MPCWAPKQPDERPKREYQAAVATESDVCDYCASPKLSWRKCKLICDDCRQINKSCADL